MARRLPSRVLAIPQMLLALAALLFATLYFFVSVADPVRAWAVDTKGTFGIGG